MMNEPEAEIERRRARAETAALLELISVFTHDLSNPLQSLTVLLELSTEDFVEGSEEHGRVLQSLEAADRMRQMIHDFSAINRGTRPSTTKDTCSAVIERMNGILKRRFERHRMRVRVNLGSVGKLPSPCAGLESVFLTLLLGAIAGASDSDFSDFEFGVTASLPAKHAGTRARIEIGLAGHRQLDQTLATIPISASHVTRAQDILGGGEVSVFLHPNDAVRIEFPVAGKQ